VEDIPFERIRPAKATAQEKKFTDMQAALQSADKQTIVGRWVVNISVVGLSSGAAAASTGARQQVAVRSPV
jgi:hypothetical protein